MAKPHLVLIGNGMAGARLLEEILKRDPDTYRISVFGQESHGNYNRIMLSPVLAGEMTADEIMLNPLHWYDENNITLYSGDPVVEINHQAQKVISLNGLEVAYDKLILATGSSPVIPPVAKTSTLEGILSFRTLDDVDRIIGKAAQAKHALVLGGGLLGLEAAYGLRKSGIEVTVIHRGKWLLNRQLDETAASLLKDELESRGINVRLGCEVETFCGVKSSVSSRLVTDASPSKVGLNKNQLGSATLSDGSVLSTELAIIAIGIQPNTKLAQTSGLDCERGILVNDRMQSSHHNIYALGECTQFGRDTFGLVAPLWDQAHVLADQLTSTADSRYRVKPCATKLKVSGIDLFSAGEFLDNEDSESLVFKDLHQGSYKKLIFRNQQLVGTVLYGAVQDGNWYFELIQQQRQIQHLSPDLIFGMRYIDEASLTDLDSSSDSSDTDATTFASVANTTHSNVLNTGVTL
ncbi:MAG: FAD-dependent oxidoreductase [Amphritea sp.]